MRDFMNVMYVKKMFAYPLLNHHLLLFYAPVPRHLLTHQECGTPREPHQDLGDGEYQWKIILREKF